MKFLTILAKHRPEFTAKLHHLRLLFGQECVPLLEEMLVYVFQMRDQFQERIFLADGIAFATLGELVIQIARSLSVTSIAQSLLGGLEDGWQLESFSDVTCQLISLHYHVDDFVPHRLDPDGAGGFKIVQYTFENLDVYDG